MYSFWLVGVLLATTGGALASTTPPNVIGATQDDVRLMLGRPMQQGVAWKLGAWWYYCQVDWLGGRRTCNLDFADGDIVTKCDTDYLPFADTPPWLEAIWGALAPAPR